MPFARWLFAAALVTAVPAAAHAEKWVGFAYSDNGPTLKIVVRGKGSVNADGSFHLAGRFRCIGSGCLGHTGVADVLFFNDASTGLGHETMTLSLRGGITCTSDEDLDDAFATLPPSVGTELIVDYECDDATGDVADTGTADITRRR
jgi:hypothetical protein